jgi:hypothetical protein
LLNCGVHQSHAAMRGRRSKNLRRWERRNFIIAIRSDRENINYFGLPLEEGTANRASVLAEITSIDGRVVHER